MPINFKLVRRRNSPNWLVQHYLPDPGYTQYWSTRTDIKPLAKKRMDAYAAEVLRMANKPEGGDRPEDLSIATALSVYQDDHGGEVASQATAKRIFQHLTEYWGNRPVSDLTLSAHKDYERDMRKAGWSAATIVRCRNVLRASLKHAVRNGDLSYAPHVPSLKVGKGRERWLTRDEAARLLWVCRHPRFAYLRVFILVALYTAARHEAILELTWDRVDLEVGTIDFNVPGVAETNKRRIRGPIPDRLVGMLRRHHRGQLTDGARLGHGRPTHVVMHRGGPLGRIDDALNAAVARAGFAGTGVTAHTLKHSAISWMLRAGVPIWQVAGLTATSAATIQKTYGHHASDDLREAANLGARGRAKQVL
jgi:integrase